MTGHAAILGHIIGSAAGLRLLCGKGLRRALPSVSLGVSLALLRFLATLLVVSVAIDGLGLLTS